MVCPLETDSENLLWPESKVRMAIDLDDGGAFDTEYWHDAYIITEVNHMDSAADENVTSHQYGSETEGYSTNTAAWNTWHAANDADSAVTAGAGTSNEEFDDLKGGSDATYDASDFDHFLNTHSNSAAGATSINDRTGLSFRVGAALYNAEPGEDEVGAFGNAMPVQVEGKDMVIEIKLLSDVANDIKI